MATLKQIDANRRNAQFSTGPTTPEGKHASSINALKSGIYAESQTIPTENSDRLEALNSEYHAPLPTPHPRSPRPRRLPHPQRVAPPPSRRRRSRIFNCTCPGCTHKYEASQRLRRRPPPPHQAASSTSSRLQRRINATERNYHRSLKALQALQPPSESPRNPKNPNPLPGNWLRSPKHPEPEPEPQPESPVPPRDAPSDS